MQETNHAGRDETTCTSHKVDQDHCVCRVGSPRDFEQRKMLEIFRALPESSSINLTSLYDPEMAHESGVDFESVLIDLLEPHDWQPANEAIRTGDEQKVRQISLQCTKMTVMSYKKETIIQDRPDFLSLFLERDSTISEDLVAAACQLGNKGCVRMLLNYGWNINQPVYFMASLLG